MAELLGSLLVRLGLESGAFKSGLTAAEKELKRAQKSFERVGQSMANFGRNMTLGVTLPIVAAAGAAVKGAQEQAAAMGQVEAALKSMGDVSGKTAAELAKSADALEMRSLFNADVILTKVTANLLTFGNVAGEQFDRAQQAAVDMATRLGTEPQSAAIMLGKALNDPIKGITALTRVGVQFTDAQKAQIKAFQATGQTAKAQGVILAEVERQFKGAAQAAADTQPWRKAQVAIDQAMDKIGEAIMPVIPVIADAVAKLASAFASLSPEMQKVVLIGGAVASALGPVLFIIGNLVSLAAPLLAAMTAASAATATAGTAAAGASVGFGALAAAAAPWIAAATAIAAVGYVIYQNWDKIAPVLTEFWNAITTTLGPPLQEVVSVVSEMFGALWSGPFGEAIKEAGRRLAAFGAAVAEVLGPVVLNVLRFLIERLADVLRAFLDFGRAIGSLVNGDIVGAFRNLWNAVNTFFGGLPSKVIGWMSQLVSGVRLWLVDKLSAVWDWVIGKVRDVGQAFYNLYDAVVGHSYVPDMVDGIDDEMRRLDSVMVQPVTKATSKAAQAFRDLQSDLAGIMATLFPDVRERLDYEGQIRTINAALDAQIKKGGDVVAIERQRLALLEASQRAYLGLDRDRAAMAPGEVFGGIALVNGGKSLEDMSREISDRFSDVFQKAAKDADTAKVLVVRSFQEMAESTLSALDRLSSAIKGGGFLSILQGVIGLGLQLGGMGLFGSKIQAGINAPIAGARAAGGPVAGGRRYLVGENGPELFTPGMSGNIIPNHQMGGMSRVEIVDTTGLFRFKVNGQIMEAAPVIAQAGASGGVQSMRRSATRRLA